MTATQTILPWRAKTYPMLAAAIEGGLEYTVWEHSTDRPGVFTYVAAQRTPLNGLRQRREKRRIYNIPSMAEAFYQAQLWAWERTDADA